MLHTHTHTFLFHSFDAVGRTLAKYQSATLQRGAATWRLRSAGNLWHNSPKYASCCGIYSCISDNSMAISCESFVMLHNSSSLKSGVICLHSNIWLITLPRFDGPARFSVCEKKREKRVYINLSAKRQSAQTALGHRVKGQRLANPVGQPFSPSSLLFPFVTFVHFCNKTNVFSYYFYSIPTTTLCE